MFGKSSANEKTNGNWSISRLRLGAYGCGKRHPGFDGTAACWTNRLVCSCCSGGLCPGSGNNSNGPESEANNGQGTVWGCCGFCGVCELAVNDCVNWKDDGNSVTNRGRGTGRSSSSQLTGSECMRQPKQHPGKIVGSSPTVCRAPAFFCCILHFCRRLLNQFCKTKESSLWDIDDSLKISWSTSNVIVQLPT